MERMVFRAQITDGKEETRKMIKELGKFNGGFIAKDYPTLEDIDVKDEWAQWAREIFMSEGWLK